MAEKQFEWSLPGIPHWLDVGYRRLAALGRTLDESLIGADGWRIDDNFKTLQQGNRKGNVNAIVTRTWILEQWLETWRQNTPQWPQV